MLSVLRGMYDALRAAGLSHPAAIKTLRTQLLVDDGGVMRALAAAQRKDRDGAS